MGPNILQNGFVSLFSPSFVCDELWVQIRNAIFLMVSFTKEHGRKFHDDLFPLMSPPNVRTHVLSSFLTHIISITTSQHGRMFGVASQMARQLGRQLACWALLWRHSLIKQLDQPVGQRAHQLRGHPPDRGSGAASQLAERLAAGSVAASLAARRLRGCRRGRLAGKLAGWSSASRAPAR